MGSSTSASYTDTNGRGSSSRATSAGSFSSSSGPGGSSYDYSGTYTDNADDSSYAGYSATGSYSFMQPYYNPNAYPSGYAVGTATGTFTQGDASSSSTHTVQSGTVTGNASSSERTGTFSEDRSSAQGSAYSETVTGPGSNSSRTDWSRSGASRHEQGQVLPGVGRRLQGFSQEDHGATGSTYHASGSSSGPTGSASWTSDSQGSSTSDLSTAGSVSNNGTYSFDLYTFNASHAYHATTNGSASGSTGSSVWTLRTDIDGWVSQTGSGQAGTFIAEEHGHDRYWIDSTFTDGRPPEHREGSFFDYDYRWEGTLSLSGGSGVVTGWVGGSLGNGWWGQVWYAVSSSVQQG
jgi:hypothetical protein